MQVQFERNDRYVGFMDLCFYWKYFTYRKLQSFNLGRWLCGFKDDSPDVTKDDPEIPPTFKQMADHFEELNA